MRYDEGVQENQTCKKLGEKERLSGMGNDKIPFIMKTGESIG